MEGRWKEERKFRFTDLRFHLISRRERNHDNFAKEMMHPNEFVSRHSSTAEVWSCGFKRNASLCSYPGWESY